MRPGTISVIIPTYGRAVFLGEALESIARQTRLPDQVLVVDDCSADPVALSRHEGLPLEVVRHARNMGPGAARNTGLSHATSEYVLFLDDDDLLAPDRIERGLQEVGPTRAHAMAVEWLLPDGSRRPYGEPFSGDLRETFNDLMHPAMGQVILRRDDVVQFDPTLRVSQDKEWWIRMAHAAVFVWADEVGLTVRRHSEERRGVSDELRYRTRAQIHYRHQGSLSPAARGRLRADVSAAALHAGRTLTSTLWAGRSLAARPSSRGGKLFFHSAAQTIRRLRLR